MNPDSLQTILDRCRVSRGHNDRMRSLMPSDKAPSLRTNFARCAIDLALEHHSALVRVVAAGEYGTGGALLRPILEASTAGYWFIYVATCTEIQALPTTSIDNPSADIPGLGEMIKSLIPIFPQIQKMSDGFKAGGTAKWLHKYTHGSTPQLTRRGATGWTEDEVMLTLIRSDMFSDLAACLETAIAPNAALSEYAFSYRDELGFELQTRFATDPIPQQPNSLPVAPLLGDGCGPAFS
ncbi:DUF6988 family protein [Lysobacter sp. CA199]|uniref:DUF6988 family protein n=1 Tax=Lysobacter sp. CA199 TaxID=3455608 RepID=UPI003F8D650D